MIRVRLSLQREIGHNGWGGRFMCDGVRQGFRRAGGYRASRFTILVRSPIYRNYPANFLKYLSRSAAGTDLDGISSTSTVRARFPFI